MDQRVTQSLILGAATLTLAASWLQGYQPSARAYARDLTHIASLKDRLATLETTLQSAGGEAAWLLQHRQRLSQLQARFPQHAQLPKVLNALVEAMRSGEVRLLNIVQGHVEPMKEGAGQLLIEGSPCYRLHVTVTAEGRYHAIMAALKRLMSESFPGVVTIEQSSMQLKQETGNTLLVTLQLSVYLLGAEAAN